MKQLRKLYIRLSSLGDVILAKDAVCLIKKDCEATFLTSAEYRDLFDRIDLHAVFYDRKKSRGITGFINWLRYCVSLTHQNFDEVIDMHTSLRTWILRFVFRVFSPRTKITKVKKERIKLWGYFTFKKFWPKSYKPEKWFYRYFENSDVEPSQWIIKNKQTKRVCVMPDSKWEGKCWPVKKYEYVLRELYKNHQIEIAVLGADQDRFSHELLSLLSDLPIKNYVGKLNLAELKKILSESWFYLGNDTGLAHLSESEGRPAVIIYGPTRADQGFGPRLLESLVIENEIACSPCSKDGRYCYRFWDQYACLSGLDEKWVYSKIEKWIISV